MQIWNKAGLMCLGLFALLTLSNTGLAQFSFATNSGALVITGYSGTSDEAIIPAATNGMPVTSIGMGAFYYRSSLTNVTIPNSVTNIGESAFFGCANIANITIPNSVQTIEWNAFALCTSLANVSIPSSVTKIVGNSFYACSSLEAFTVDSLNPSYTNMDGVIFSKDLSLLVAYPCGKSGSYGIPETVTLIGEFAFAVCRNITNLTIPSSVTNLGFWAFSQCESISRITIPQSVQYIDDFAFQDCTLLREVYFHGNAPQISGFGSRIFIGDQVNLYYLPNTTGWDEFLTFLNLSGILWNPILLPNDGGFGVNTNSFGFNITGTANIPIVVEASTNLTGSAWVPLQSGVLTNGSVYFNDSEWMNFPKRFYRIRSP